MQALRAAGEAWAAQPLRVRLEVLARLRKGLADRADELTQLLAEEIGRPVTEGYAAEILPTLACLRWLERRAGSILAPRVLRRWPARRVQRWEPYGVIGLISPGNYPLFLSVASLGPALAAGNAVLWKPSELAPCLASAVKEILDRSGVGDAVSLVLGGPAAGEAVVDAGCDRVVFIGSSRTGRRVLSRLAEHGTPAVAELSGCDPALVLADANLGETVAALVWARCVGAGQTCLAPRRIYVEEAIYERFLETTDRCLARLRVGDPFDPRTEVGPLRSEVLLRSAEEAIAASVRAGARLVRGGRRAADPSAGDRYYLAPTLLADCREDMPVLMDDLAGPVVTVLPVASAAAGLARINARRDGLTASLWTAGRARGTTLAAALPGAIVSVNSVLLPAADPAVPFGGRGASGYGRLRGGAGLLEMVRARVDETPGLPGGWNPLGPGRAGFPYAAGTLELLRAVTAWSTRPGLHQTHALWQAVRRYQEHRRHE